MCFDDTSLLEFDILHDHSDKPGSQTPDGSCRDFNASHFLAGWDSSEHVSKFHLGSRKFVSENVFSSFFHETGNSVWSVQSSVNVSFISGEAPTL